MLEQEYQKAIDRNKHRHRNTDEYGGHEGEEGEDEDEEEEEEEEEQIDQEEVLAKMQHCKELIDGVKRQTWKMSKKLQVHRSARAYVERFEGKLSRGKGYQQRGKELVKRLQRSWKNFSASLVPWEMKIKTIESHFGSVVASYFTFLRWLLWMSAWLAAMPTCFIIIPEVSECVAPIDKRLAGGHVYMFHHHTREVSECVAPIDKRLAGGHVYMFHHHTRGKSVCRPN
ncbi:transmembrane channel-like protein [Plakobranchus ocellatus]|uniref:Transmembrane channel-like protein n=1 Tax=Plakobranchus ocellatus TaxID=259542 RepID=A0AAV3Z9N4_9GAST|nr:transmembrane channel-like protein [Plakobranchus ocellatus]